MRIRFPMPRVSALRHPLALLRKELGIGQKEMAGLVEVSTATIQSIELGRLEMSERLASRISDQTGVSMSWLLAGKPRTPIPAAESRGYCFVRFTREHFEIAQSRDRSDVTEEAFLLMIRLMVTELVAIFRSAKSANDDAPKRCYYRVEKALGDLGTSLQQDFGNDLDYEIASYHQMAKEITRGMTKSEIVEITPIPESEMPSDEDLEKMLEAADSNEKKKM